MKRQTISQRWTAWTRLEPGWAYSALAAMALAYAALIVHLGAGGGHVRQAFLWAMIACWGCCAAILVARRQWWWASFWGAVMVLVIAWELASYFGGAAV